MTTKTEASGNSLQEERRRSSKKLIDGWLTLWGYFAAICGGVVLFVAAPSGFFSVHRYGWIPAVGVLLYAFGYKIYCTYVVWQLRQSAEERLVVQHSYKQLAPEKQRAKRDALRRQYKEPSMQAMWIRSFVTSVAFIALYLAMVTSVFDVAWLINLIPKQGSGLRQITWLLLTGLFVIVGLCCYLWLCRLMPYRIRKRSKTKVPEQIKPEPEDSFFTKLIIRRDNRKRRRQARPSRLSPVVRFGVAWVVSFVVFNLAMMILYGLSKNGTVAHFFN